MVPRLNKQGPNRNQHLVNLKRMEDIIVVVVNLGFDDFVVDEELFSDQEGTGVAKQQTGLSYQYAGFKESVFLLSFGHQPVVLKNHEVSQVVQKDQDEGDQHEQVQIGQSSFFVVFIYLVRSTFCRVVFKF